MKKIFMSLLLVLVLIINSISSKLAGKLMEVK